MSYLGREGSPLAQRPVNKKMSTQSVAKSELRADRSLSGSPLPPVELSSAVTELVLENEKLIGETIVLRSSYKAVAEKCGVYQSENTKLKEELNMLRNELGLAHDAVTNKDGTVVNYKKECERLNLIVERQAMDIDQLKATLDKATVNLHSGSATVATGTYSQFAESIAEEITRMTSRSQKLISALKTLETNVVSVPAGTTADGTMRNQWTKELTVLESQLVPLRKAREENKDSTDGLAKAMLSVRNLCVDSVDVSMVLLRECIAGRSA